MPFWFYLGVGAFGFVLLTFIIYLFLIKTSSSNELSKYEGALFAHRGLHNEKMAENSISAFLASAERGFGIELDVRLSLDGEVVVFHDDDLRRVCGVDKNVCDLTAAELSALSLSGTDEGVPRFCDVLAAISGRVPLLIEIKENREDTGISLKVAEILSSYRGDFLVESFNPKALKTFKKALPSATVGILSKSFWKDKEHNSLLFKLMGLLVTNVVCRPAFIAFDANDHKNVSLRVARAFFRTKTFAWTVRSEDEGRLALKRGFDGLIFENYLPILCENESQENDGRRNG